MARHKRHHHRRRRNPFGVDSGAVTSILYGSAGYVVARAVPAVALPSQNTGIMGYALNLGTAFAMKFLIPGSSGSDLFVGGAIATVTRIISDQLGTKIAGLSGDPAFTLGAYWNSYFAVPTVSDPYGRVSASPYPQPVAALPAGPGKSGSSGMGRYSRASGGRFG